MCPGMSVASKEDFDLIVAALVTLLRKSPAPQMKLVDYDTAYRNLMTAKAEGRLFVYGDFIILVDVGTPWHSNKPVLIEELVARFRKVYGNTPQSAVAQLEVLARKFNCVAVASGDTQVGLMAEHYKSEGYTPLGSQFYKEIS